MLTQKRDLKSGVPFWQRKSLPPIKTNRLVKSAHADVAVIGTGISGALVADALLHSGLSVIAVDRRKPMSGSTPASTALLLFELDTPLTVLSRKIGKNDAARAWARSVAAVEALGGRIRDLGVNCDFRERSSLYLPGNLLDAGGLREEAKARTRIALRSELLGRGDLKRIAGIAKSNAILSHGNGEADPVKLTAGLWREFHQRGGEVISPFEAEELDESRTGVKIKSRDGRQITAKHIVLCSGYEMPKFFRLKGLRIISTWALATKPQARMLWSGRHLIWEAAEPYLYFRTTSHGRIIVGGEDEDFAGDEKRDGLLKAKTKRIGALARRIFPDLNFEPDYAWTGSFGESETGLPVIGLMPGFRRSYCVMGFGGNGITFSMLAAQLICREINGISDPDADLFRP